MKVCTDACLFGALVASSKQLNGHCLDIGTGTGLLPLMIAQKNEGIKIDAFEIDTDAAAQAQENISVTQWADNIQVFNEDILKLMPGTPSGSDGHDIVNKKYDCIISNPPFFEDDLQSPDAAKNNAKHNSSLSFVQLLQVVHSLLVTDGFFAVLLPYPRVDYFIEEAAKTGLHLSKQILIKQTFKHKFFRGILFFKRVETQATKSEIIIKDLEHNYTPEFVNLLKDYYLFL